VLLFEEKRKEKREKQKKEIEEKREKKGKQGIFFLLIKISKLVVHRESLISTNVAFCSTTISSNLTH